MTCFADIIVSQGSVATHARCGGIFNIHLTTNLPRNLSVNFLNSVKIWQSYGYESVAYFFWPTLYKSLSLRPSLNRGHAQGETRDLRRLSVTKAASEMAFIGLHVYRQGRN